MVKNYRPGGVGMLPAAPATYLVHAYLDDNQVEIIRTNVLGWQVGADRTMLPLVLDPRAADEEPWTVIHPDGRVESSSGHSWPDEDSWVDSIKRTRRDAE